MNRIKISGVLLGIAATLVAAMPAHAQTAAGGGGGAVDGSVTLSPGYAVPDTKVSDPQTFTFNSFAIVGAFAGASTAPAAAACASASITASGVTGASSPIGGQVSNLAADAGTVNAFTASGACVNGGSVSCSLSGSFTRAGSNVTVVLTGSCTINGVTVGVTIIVNAEFAASSPTQNPLTTFQFAGAYVAAG